MAHKKVNNPNSLMSITVFSQYCCVTMSYSGRKRAATKVSRQKTQHKILDCIVPQLMLTLSTEETAKSRWSFLSGVYARGSKRFHAGKWKKPVMDSLTLEKDIL